MSEKLAAIGEITAGVAHEINNPLAVIQGNLDVVRDDLGPRAEPLRTEFTLIQEQIQAIHILVTKLLHFARPEEYADTGSGNDPDTVIRDTMPLVQHLLSKARIEVELDLAAGVIVAMNHTELQQVLINLMVNAIQAMPDGGRLTVRTRREDAKGRSMVRISVSDTGAGMTPEVLGRIFDPFFTTKRSKGTGLGLSISRNLVTRGGGTIAVESAPGQGTRFEILLPIVRGRGSGAVDLASGEKGQKHLRVADLVDAAIVDVAVEHDEIGPFAERQRPGLGLTPASHRGVDRVALDAFAERKPLLRQEHRVFALLLRRLAGHRGLDDLERVEGGNGPVARKRQKRTGIAKRAEGIHPAPAILAHHRQRDIGDGRFVSAPRAAGYWRRRPSSANRGISAGSMHWTWAIWCHDGQGAFSARAAAMPSSAARTARSPIAWTWIWNLAASKATNMSLI